MRATRTGRGVGAGLNRRSPESNAGRRRGVRYGQVGCGVAGDVGARTEAHRKHTQLVAWCRLSSRLGGVKCVGLAPGGCLFVGRAEQTREGGREWLRLVSSSLSPARRLARKGTYGGGVNGVGVAFAVGGGRAVPPWKWEQGAEAERPGQPDGIYCSIRKWFRLRFRVQTTRPRSAWRPVPRKRSPSLSSLCFYPIHQTARLQQKVHLEPELHITLYFVNFEIHISKFHFFLKILMDALSDSDFVNVHNLSSK